MTEILLVLCGVFYAVLCVFSVVTGLMYASGKRELNPLELSDRFMQRYADKDKRRRFTVRMGWVTFAVGIAQGVFPARQRCAVLDRTGFHAVFPGVRGMEAEREVSCLSAAESRGVCSDPDPSASACCESMFFRMMRCL